MTTPDNLKVNATFAVRAFPLPVSIDNPFGDYDTLLRIAVRRINEPGNTASHESFLWVACSLLKEGLTPSLVTDESFHSAARTVMHRLASEHIGVERLILNEQVNMSKFEEATK